MNHYSQISGEQAERERATRAEVSLTCEIRQGTRPWTRVTLHDISNSGFRIDWRPGFDERSPIYIRIQGMDLLLCQMRWKRENSIGCEFMQRLHPAVFDHVVRQSQLQG